MRCNAACDVGGGHSVAAATAGPAKVASVERFVWSRDCGTAAAEACDRSYNTDHFFKKIKPNPDKTSIKKRQYYYGNSQGTLYSIILITGPELRAF